MRTPSACGLVWGIISGSQAHKGYIGPEPRARVPVPPREPEMGHKTLRRWLTLRRPERPQLVRRYPGALSPTRTAPKPPYGFPRGDVGLRRSPSKQRAPKAKHNSLALPAPPLHQSQQKPGPWRGGARPTGYKSLSETLRDRGPIRPPLGHTSTVKQPC